MRRRVCVYARTLVSLLWVLMVNGDARDRLSRSPAVDADARPQDHHNDGQPDEEAEGVGNLLQPASTTGMCNDLKTTHVFPSQFTTHQFAQGERLHVD